MATQDFHGEVRKIHFNFFITWFVITRFWIQHGSRMDPKNVWIIIIEK